MEDLIRNLISEVKCLRQELQMMKKHEGESSRHFHDKLSDKEKMLEKFHNFIETWQQIILNLMKEKSIENLASDTGFEHYVYTGKPLMENINDLPFQKVSEADFYKFNKNPVLEDVQKILNEKDNPPGCTLKTFDLDGKLEHHPNALDFEEEMQEQISSDITKERNLHKSNILLQHKNILQGLADMGNIDEQVSEHNQDRLPLPPEKDSKDPIDWNNDDINAADMQALLLGKKHDVLEFCHFPPAVMDLNMTGLLLPVNDVPDPVTFNDVYKQGEIQGTCIKVQECSKASTSPNTRRSKNKEDYFSLREHIKSICNIFQYSGRRQVLLMVVGTLFALLNGTMTPFLSVIFGDSANLLIYQRRTSMMKHCFDSSHQNETCITYEEREKAANGFRNEMDLYTIRYLVVFGVALITAFLQIFCWERASDMIVMGLRKDYLRQLLRQDIQWFDSNTMTDLSTKLTDDLERIRDGLGARVPMLVQNASLLFCGQAVAYWRSWRLSLILLPGLPILGLCVALVASIASKSSQREQLRYGIAGGVASQALSGIRTVSAFGTQSYILNRYEKALEEGRKSTLSKHYVLAILTGFINLISFGLYSLGFWYGSTLYYHDYISPGSLLTVLFCILQAGLAFGANLVAIVEVSTAIALARNLFKTIHRIPKIDAYSDTGLTVDVDADIHIQQVTFHYPTRPELRVLDRIDIRIPRGKVIALVGPSGSGKSSIVNLIMRFYDPTSGKVLIGGCDVRHLNVNWMRNQMGVVSQEPNLFDTSIKENIRYGCESASEDDIVQAAKLANAHHFIMDLPQGYDTLVGERGSQLSGGQKQRIAIARALVRKPRILLLDEATSALDSESEAVVQEALQRAMQGRTTLIIAHRLSTIRNAHQIYVIKDGVVAESGTHSELVSMRGQYFHMLSVHKSQPATINSFHQINLNQCDMSEEWKRKLRNKCDNGINVCDIMERSVSFLGIFKMKSLPYGLICMTLLGCVISGLLVPAFAAIYSYMVTIFVVPKEEFLEKVVLWSGVLMALAVISCFSYFISLVGSCLSTEKMIQRTRLETFHNILSQQVSWFDNSQFTTLSLTNTLSRDPPQIKAVAGSRFGSLLTGSINLVLAVVIAFSVNTKLASICCLIYPVLIFLSYRLSSYRYINFAKEDVKIKTASKLASECIENIKTVQMLSLERVLYRQYCDAIDKSSKSSLRQTVMFSVIYSLSNTIIYLIYVAVSIFSAQMLLNNEISLFCILIILFEVSFTAPLIGIACNYTQDFIKGKRAVENLVKLKSIKSTLDVFLHRGLKLQVKGHVVFHDVEFAYPSRPRVRILKGFHLVVEAGQRVAIVGKSGCGKSTVISLLQRFYNHNKGQILIDGEELDKWELSHLRRNMGLVTQEPVLFEGTIRENIRYGCIDRDVHDQEVFDAARKANIHNFIISLPLGYSTNVGSSGTKLSTGQKQRVAIARALIRNPRILLLDEATSALDNHSEKLVQEALDTASRGRTTIVIAHRLSTVQTADVIVVMEDGRIVEKGTHSELVALGAKYYSMTRNQFLNI